MKKLTVMIPCYNEEKGVGKVISSIPKSQLRKLGYKTEVIVINNRSTDRTAEVARLSGAIVVYEDKPGKGHAIRTGIKNISNDTDIVVMLDGDDTYKSFEMLRMVEPIDTGFCEAVIGTRLDGKIVGDSMHWSHYVVNKVFTFMVQTFYNPKVRDVCTGYWSWKFSVLKKLSKHLESPGFAIEMEMATKMGKLGVETYSVPVTLDYRAGDSSLSAIPDGLRITHMWAKNLFWVPRKTR
jgi:glycosyltransferase involved in cell wall biosynthesis